MHRKPLVKFVVVRLLIATALPCVSPAIADEWGSLSGRVVFDGTAPAPNKLEITRDEEVCGTFGLHDESLIVNSKNDGLKNVVVWLSSKADVPVHPSLATMPPVTKLDNKECRFVPRIVQLRTGQTLQSLNSDSVAHNVAVFGRRNSPFSIVIPTDEPLERTFSREELMPIRVDCSIHAWMRAYLVITEHPYSAVTNENGEFTISKIPHGDWQFRFWHERPGYLPEISIGTAAKKLKRGTVDLTISSSEQQLGDITVAESVFVDED